MSDLFFNKNKFINNEPTRLVRPIPNDPNKLGRKTIEQVKEDMHLMNRSKIEEPKINKDIQENKLSKLESFKKFTQWNHK